MKKLLLFLKEPKAAPLLVTLTRCKKSRNDSVRPLRINRLQNEVLGQLIERVKGQR